MVGLTNGSAEAGRPDEPAVAGAPTATAQEMFYATVFHELTHRAGGERRRIREKSKKFADKPYCFEELVAELGAAFLCADLGITNEPRPDHAQYIAQYLVVLKDDSRAIFRAATAASAAVEYLQAFSRPREEAA